MSLRHPARRSTAAQVVMALLLVVGCDLEQADEVSVVRVGGEAHTYAEFEVFVRRNLGEEAALLPGAVLSPLFEEFVNELCLRRLAIDRGYDDAEGVDPAEYLLSELSGVEISDSEIRRYYDEHRAEFERPLRLTLGQILTQEKAVAEEVRRRIDDGVEFVDAVEGLPDAVFGGYLKDVTMTDIPTPLREAVFALEQGAISPALVADYGIHIFHVLSRLPEETLSLDRARETIRGELLRSSAGRGQVEMVREARLRYNVELLPSNLPFELIAPGETDDPSP